MSKKIFSSGWDRNSSVGSLATHQERVIALTITRREAKLALVPELTALLEQRFHLLKLIKLEGPVGRRPLSTISGFSEREIRMMIERFNDQSLVRISKEGVTITSKGIDVLFALDQTIEETSGRRAIADRLMGHFDIEAIHVVEGDADQTELTKKLLAMHAAKQFRSHIGDGKIVAVTGGSTVAAIPHYMQHREQLSDLQFIAARGGVGEQLGLQANMIAASFAEVCGASYKAFYYPETLSEEAHEVFQREPEAQEMMKLYDQADCVIHGIGDAKKMAKLRNSSEEERRILDDMQAKGEAFGYYFNRQGEVVHRIRTVGIQIEQLRDIPMIIAVAGGKSKAEALCSYLISAPRQTSFITDEGAAKEMLALLQEQAVDESLQDDSYQYKK